MAAYKMYRQLREEPNWATDSRKVRWLAARYYSRVGSLKDLKRLSRSDESTGYHRGLTGEQVYKIVHLR